MWDDGWARIREHDLWQDPYKVLHLPCGWGRAQIMVSAPLCVVLTLWIELGNVSGSRVPIFTVLCPIPCGHATSSIGTITFGARNIGWPYYSITIVHHLLVSYFPNPSLGIKSMPTPPPLWEEVHQYLGSHNPHLRWTIMSQATSINTQWYLNIFIALFNW